MTAPAGRETSAQATMFVLTGLTPLLSSIRVDTNRKLPAETLREYVVPPELAKCFDALARGFPGFSTAGKDDASRAACGEVLFVSGTKYDSGCGWPAFYAPADEGAIDEETDTSSFGGDKAVARVRFRATHQGEFLGVPPTLTGIYVCHQMGA